MGVDLSPRQIDLARSRNKSSHVEYLVGDATLLPEVVQGKFDKISLYFSFQYLERMKDGRDAIAGMLSLLKPGGRIVIGDVPDHRYLHKFYPSIPKRLRYYLRLLAGKSDMGKFWKEAEVIRICRQYGARCERREQPAFLPYSHYRCDYLISIT